MSSKGLMIKIIFIFLIFFSLSAKAGAPLWTFTPLTATNINVPSNSTATVQYQVTNQSSKTHTLNMQPIAGVTQLTTGLGICRNPFALTGKASCVLSLQINGNQLTQAISNGPIVCDQGSTLQCYRPTAADILNITPVPVSNNATIYVIGSPLTLTSNGLPGSLTIINASSSVTAINITSNFTGTALDGNVTETGNTCASLTPQSSCTITYTPGGSVVSSTNFTIQGSNTNTLTASIQIDAGVALNNVAPSSGSASGGTSVTLSGSGLTGTTNITFGNSAATSFNVVNSTTVTAVTPANSIGVVDVTITTPSGTATLTNGYTYVATAVGQAAFGGIIACLNGGANNLIAATTDISTGIIWGGLALSTNATSTTNGASNTATINTTPGQTTPNAASICGTFQVDSQGNTPCQAGNTCFNDWFLPAGNNTSASGQLNCLYVNQSAIGGFSSAAYWSSTETNANNAWSANFTNGSELTQIKNTTNRVRCVRAFTP